MEFTINVQSTKIPALTAEAILKVVAKAITDRTAAVLLSSLDAGYPFQITNTKDLTITITKQSS